MTVNHGVRGSSPRRVAHIFILILFEFCMEKKTVVIAMSGGVDSSVTALLLKKKYKVIGAFMKNFSETKNKLTGECSWIDDRRDAQKICAILDIPFVTFDFEKEYKKLVLEPMFMDYKKGLTPNPDILCNTVIKFPLFWREARKLGANYIATGHHARIRKGKKGFSLLMGKDKGKDQSYFLYGLKQDDLSHTLFPVGGLQKDKVRKIAWRNRFPNWNKLGTRGICFVGKVDLRAFLEKKIKQKKGKVISPEGEIIGEHPGTSYFTIGQRAGDHIGIIIDENYRSKVGTKVYVAEKRKGNILVVAPYGHEALLKDRIKIGKLHLVNHKDFAKKGLKARIRHLGKLHLGRLLKIKGKWVFVLKKGIEWVAEGQSVVLYKGEKVVGGGEIA